MTAKRIVTVTLNPALDMTGAMGELKPGAVNLIQRSNLNPGGKGVNVAKVLAELGAEVSVTGFLGDDNQDPFAHLFEQKGIEDRFVRVHGASRINVKLVEETGRVTDLELPWCGSERAEHCGVGRNTAVTGRKPRPVCDCRQPARRPVTSAISGLDRHAPRKR